jgi:serine/threonine-protein kinase
MDPEPGLVVADRFRLLRLLRKGGMGKLWLAHHTRLDIPCAVKFIREDLVSSREILARFEREAKAAAQIRSPHVVQILDHGVWADAPYIAMEWLEGEDLEARLGRSKALDPFETFAIASQVARALTKAHASGLIHRDLKPANIFLARDGDHEVVKVLDFGVVKIMATGLEEWTASGSLLGTPSYMSPEQARGLKVVDHRADIWALGVIVFRCLVGRLPVPNDTGVGDQLFRIITGPRVIPSSIAPVPPGFDDFWIRATAGELSQRFQSAKELIDALGPALGIHEGQGGKLGYLRSGEVPIVNPSHTAATPSTPVPEDETTRLEKGTTPVTTPITLTVRGNRARAMTIGLVLGVLALLALVSRPLLRFIKPADGETAAAAPPPPTLTGTFTVGPEPRASGSTTESATDSPPAVPPKAPVVTPAGPEITPVSTALPSGAPRPRAPSSASTRTSAPLQPPGKRPKDFGF